MRFIFNKKDLIYILPLLLGALLSGWCILMDSFCKDEEDACNNHLLKNKTPTDNKTHLHGD